MTKDGARAALEAIAKPEPGNEQIDKILAEASQTYLDHGDRRVLLTAIARASGNTPLALQLKRDTLTMIDPKHAELVAQPEKNHFAAFLQGQGVDAQLVEAVKAGQVESAPLVARALQENSALSESLWNELAPGKTRPDLTKPDGLMAAAGVPTTPENQKKVEKMYAPIRVKKDINLGDYAIPTLLGGAMLLSVLTQIGMSGTVGGGQEH